MSQIVLIEVILICFIYCSFVSAFQNSDQPKASPSRRKFIIDTSEMKKDDPVEVAGVAEQTNPELEQEEDFNPSDYYKYSIMKKRNWYFNESN